MTDTQPQRQRKRPAPIPQERGDLPPLGIIIADDDGERVYCHVCGLGFRNLARHALSAHGLNADMYRERFELTRGQSLVSPQCAQPRREIAIAGNSIANLLAANSECPPKGARPRGTPARLAERISKSERQ